MTFVNYFLKFRVILYHNCNSYANVNPSHPAQTSYSFSSASIQLAEPSAKCYNARMSRESKGVFATTKKDNSIYYRVSVTHRGKHISLGSFDKEADAAACYEFARNLLDYRDYTCADYHDSFPLSFEKWIVLLNFRDNGLYFKTPIYLRPNYFQYYLSRERILIFDKDDLFYYASHKIMARGNHLFVSDYGMQVNIMNRYDIMSYGVQGRDYLFANGNENDFRYSNIIILNKYRGVREKTNGHNTVYEAYIHINGMVKIGSYSTAEEAAVAYNKAIDVLMKKNFKRKFTPNYIETFSAKEYAELYTELTISERITHLIV